MTKICKNENQVLTDVFSLQVMNSLPSSATWEHQQCPDIMYVTSKRREGELHILHIHSLFWLWYKSDTLLMKIKSFLFLTPALLSYQTSQETYFLIKELLHPEVRKSIIPSIFSRLNGWIFWPRCCCPPMLFLNEVTLGKHLTQPKIMFALL